MRSFDLFDCRIARRLSEGSDCLSLEDHPKLECIADQRNIQRQDLQSALRDGNDQAFRFQPWNQFADCTEGLSGKSNQFSLSHELTGLDLARSEERRVGKEC